MIIISERELKMSDEDDVLKLAEEKARVTKKSDGLMKGAFSLTSLNYLTLVGDIIVTIYTSIVIENISEIGIYDALLQYVPLINLIVVFGFKNTANKFIGKYDTAEKYQKSAGVTFSILIFNCGLSIIFASIFLAIPHFFSRILTGNGEYVLYTRLLGISLIFSPILVLNHILIIRYKFKDYMIANLIGNALRLISLVYFLFSLRDISAYFYSTFIGNGFIFFFLIIRFFKIFGKPDFKLPFKEIIKFALPVFLSQVLVYLKQYIYNIIFLLYFQNLAQMGLLYYIKKIFNIVLVIFNSLHSILTVHYASIIYKENRQEKYYKTTWEISKLFQLISFIIGFLFIMGAPFFNKFITSVYYSSEDIFLIGTMTMIFFGVFILLNTFYYIPPTMVNIFDKSTVILKVHAKSSVIYLLSYLILIRFFGMVGIAIGQLIGFIFFLIFNVKEIQKELKIGFDMISFKKIILASIPFVISTIILIIIAKNDVNLWEITLNQRIIAFPWITFLYSVILILLSFLTFILLMRKMHVFSETDHNMFLSLFGKKIGKIFVKLLITIETQI